MISEKQVHYILSNEAKMAEIEFHEELKSLQIHFPGGNAVNFNDDQALLDFLKQQYPTWKNKCIVTSIPIARIPRLFLHCHQIIEPLDKKYKGLEKGEHGEIKVYNELLKLRDKYESGICVFPNVDGNHFSSKEAHVEIDMVVVHPLKGVFVISIKNTTSIKPKEVANNIKKHINCIRLLCTFGQYIPEKPDSQIFPKSPDSQVFLSKSDINYSPENKECIEATESVPVVGKNEKISLFKEKNNDVSQCVPIHGIIMSHRIEIKQKTLRDYFTCKENGFRFLFQPDDMNNFQSKWISILSDVPVIKDKVVQSKIELLAARLTALNSMEGSLALIHNQITSNRLQEIHLKQKDKLNILKKQFPDNGFIEEIKVAGDELLLSDGSSKKKSTILWTNEQLEVINVIIKSISKSKGCRIIVTGPRGSGKTMLLVFIAKLAKKIFQNYHKDDTDGNVVIRDGRLGSSLLLFERLEKRFFDSGIDVVLVADKDISKRKLILVDEANYLFLTRFPEKFSKSQHVIFFTSQPKFSESNRDFAHLQLTYSLRSTVQLTNFIESFRHQDKLNEHIKALSVHNFQGSEPDIRYIDSNNAEDGNHLKFVDLCTSTILERIERAKGLREILVTPYVHPITLNRILSNLQQKRIDFQYRHPNEQFSLFQINKGLKSGYLNADHMSSNELSKNIPEVVISTGNHIDGVEYGSVIIFLDHSLPIWWDDFIFDSLYIAITRATTDLAIVINNNKEPPMIKATHKRITEPHVKEFALSAFSLLSVSNFSREIDNIIEDSYWSKDPVLIVGNHIPSNALSMNKGGRQSEEVWYTLVADKQVVIHPDVGSLSSSFRNFSMYDGVSTHRYSAIIFICHSLDEYDNLINDSMTRHGLLYHFYEFQLFICPIYLLISHPPPVKRFHSPLICDYLRSIFKSEGIHFSSSSEYSESKDLFSWVLLKEKGTEFYKSGDLLSAISYYRKGLSFLQGDCDKIIHIERVQNLIPIFENLSRFCTNISKVLFELAKTLEKGDKKNRMIQESLEFAEKSVEMDPCWRKGFYRIAEAKEFLNENIKEEKAMSERKSICNYTENIKRKKKRSAILRYKLKKSPSFSLIRHKENVFLIDGEPDKGHFISLKDALDIHGSKPVSFVINSGTYHCNFFFEGKDVDIVGNWNAIVCPQNNWLVEESPVIFESCDNPMPIFSVLGKSKLSLSRVTLYNKRSNTVQVIGKSDVTLNQCFFSSKNSPAVNCSAASSLNIHGCWSRDSACSVKGTNECRININHSYFYGIERDALEFREGVFVNIKNCYVSHCKFQGMTGLRSTVNIISCTFENNSINMTNEGSIFMCETFVEIKDTCIQNQSGVGVAIKHGKGIFRSLNIQHCKDSGILAEAPCDIFNCSFTKCDVSAVRIGDNIDGEVIMQDNMMKQCRFEICMDSSNAPFPIVNGERWTKKRVPKQLLIRDKVIDIAIEGKFYHEKIVDKHKIIRRSISTIKYESVDPQKYAYCEYCWHPVDINPLNGDYLLCKGCESYFYCNLDCYEKHSDKHRYECEHIQKSVDAYRKKIGWKGMQ